MPSIPQFHYDLHKCLYNVCPSIPYVSISLKLSTNMESDNNLGVIVDIAGRLQIMSQEWNLITNNVETITSFFMNGSVPQLQPPDTMTTNSISYLNTCGNTYSCIVLHFRDNSISITNEDWWCFKHALDCITLRIQHLEKMKIYYDSRINYFKKRIKMSQVKTLDETSLIVDNTCDNASIVDQEIKCYLKEYLFYSYLLN